MAVPTVAIVFVIVWVALALAFCLFKTVGGSFLDVCTCDFGNLCWCFSGPCGDCWGVGGRIRRGRFDDPFRDYNIPKDSEASELPAILVSEDGLRKDTRRPDELVRNEAIDELRSRGGGGRTRAEEALLLSSRTRDDDGGVDQGPVVV